MKKQAKHTTKNAAKKSAAKPVKTVGDMVKENADKMYGDAVPECCKPQVDPQVEAYHRGRREAQESHLRELEGDPWVQYNLHSENVRDINARLDELDLQKKRLMSRLSSETARRDAFRQMVIDLAHQP